MAKTTTRRPPPLSTCSWSLLVLAVSWWNEVIAAGSLWGSRTPWQRDCTWLRLRHDWAAVKRYCTDGPRALALLSSPASFVHDFQDETWDHPPCRLATSAAAAELLSSKLTWRDGHLFASRTIWTNHCYVDIDNDVVIWADRRWRWDLSRLCWDTGCGIWQKGVGRRHSCWLKWRPGL